MCNFEYYNPNPKKRVRRDGTPMKWHKGDCHVRATAKALGLSWKDTLTTLYESALERCDTVGSIDNIAEVLEKNGYKKGVISKEWMMQRHRRPTITEVLRDLGNENMTVLFKCTHHVATAINGTLYDTWNCSNEVVWRFWYKKTEEDE